MTLTSGAFQRPGSEGNAMDETKIIRTTRGVCISRGDDAAEGEVRKVPVNIANILLGEGSAVLATEEELKRYESKKKKSDAAAAA